LANLVIYSTRSMIRLDPSLNATLVGFINYSANCSAQFLGQWICTSSFEGLCTQNQPPIYAECWEF